MPASKGAQLVVDTINAEAASAASRSSTRSSRSARRRGTSRWRSEPCRSCSTAGPTSSSARRSPAGLPLLG
ncbi:MAG: hypothetical protein R2713_06580 [Ilumatobacteraceae bacterium]